MATSQIKVVVNTVTNNSPAGRSQQQTGVPPPPVGLLHQPSKAKQQPNQPQQKQNGNLLLLKASPSSAAGQQPKQRCFGTAAAAPVFQRCSTPRPPPHFSSVILEAENNVEDAIVYSTVSIAADVDIGEEDNDEENDKNDGEEQRHMENRDEGLSLLVDHHSHHHHQHQLLPSNNENSLLPVTPPAAVPVVVTTTAAAAAVTSDEEDDEEEEEEEEQQLSPQSPVPPPLLHVSVVENNLLCLTTSGGHKQQQKFPSSNSCCSTGTLGTASGGDSGELKPPQNSRRIGEQQHQFCHSDDGTLNGSLSSPELLQLLPVTTLSSGNPSPLPTSTDLIAALQNPHHQHPFQLPPTPSPSTVRNTNNTNSHVPLSLSSSLQSLGSRRQTQTQQQLHQKASYDSKRLERPKVQLNGGSILSVVSADHVLDGAAQKLMLSSQQRFSSPQGILPPSGRGGGGDSSSADDGIPTAYAHADVELQRQPSISSQQSAESRRNLTILRTIQRTHHQLKRTRLWHAFYLFALPFYTLLGAMLFQYLDGSNSDQLMRAYEHRCRGDRKLKLLELNALCANATTATGCFDRMSDFLVEVETCYRKWHEKNKTMTHPMSDFTNAIIYAFSVYTTIGYGTISPSSTVARIATVIYGAFGIPLFFAFVKEEGNMCRTCFVSVYNRVKKCYKARRKIKKLASSPIVNNIRSLRPKNSSERSDLLYRGRLASENDAKKPPPLPPDCIRGPAAVVPLLEKSLPVWNDEKTVEETPPNGGKKCRQRFKPFVRRCSELSMLRGMSGGGSIKKSEATGQPTSFAVTIEQRRVFFCGVLVFIIYLLLVSLLFTQMTDWDFWTAFYFLFNSVALIGFGDVFPSQSRIILVNMFFIVLGVVLFSMCYFILQEEIRVKAFEASRKARMSICKYSQSLMLHTRPITNWSRRNSPNFDDPVTGSAFDRLRKRRQSAPAITVERAPTAASASIERAGSRRRKISSPPTPTPRRHNS